MSIKATSVIGLKVITMDTGRQVDTVSDVIYDPAQNTVQAILIDKGGWFSEAKLILIGDVVSIGTDAVMIKSEDVVKTASEVPSRVASILNENNNLTSDKVITTDGKDLGRVSDLYFDMPGGRVHTLEVSQGVLNALSGKKEVKISDIQTVGVDSIIVSHYVEVEFEDQAQNKGLQGMANNLAGAAAGAWDKTKEKAVEIKESDKVQNALHKAQTAVQTTVDKSKEGITNLKEGYQSGDLQAGIKDKFTQVKETVAAKTDDAKQAVSQTVSAKTTQAGDALDQKRVDGVLGKVVGDVYVIGHDDEIIAGPGTPITDQLLASAKNREQILASAKNVSDV